jgi:hypothetical protein
MDVLNFYKIKEYIIQNRTIIIFSILIAIVCYGYELFNFSFSIDEEFDSFNNAIDITRRFSNGRWGIYFLNLLIFPHSVMPYLPTLITILGIALSSILIVNSEKCDLTSKIVFSTIFITYPLHTYYMAFNILNYAVGIGMVLTVISYLIARKSIEGKRLRTGSFLISIFILAYTFSIYQGLLPIFVIIVLFHLLNLALNDRSVSVSNILRFLLLYCIIFCSSFVVYKIFDFGLKYLVVGSVKIDNPYIDSFILWGREPVGQILFNIIKSIGGYVLGVTFYGALPMISLLVLVPFVFFVLMKSVNSKKLLAFIFISFLLSPFMVLFFAGSFLPARSMLALPFLLAFIWWLSYQYLNRLMKQLMFGVLLFVFLNNTYHTTRLFYAAYVSWQADRDMANRIIERIFSLDLMSKNNRIDVVFVGNYQHPANELFFQFDVFGSSFFYWDNGRSDRISCFFKSIGINQLNVLPKGKFDSEDELIKSIPCWPQKGSVALIGNVVVVKLSEQLNTLNLGKI